MIFKSHWQVDATMFVRLVLPVLISGVAVGQTQSAAEMWQNAQVPGPFLCDSHVIVPPNIPSEAWANQSQAIRNLLTSFKLDTSPGEHIKLIGDSRYILYGDLFKTGETYALVELPMEREIDPYWDGGRLAFARLLNGKWELRGLWDINSTWRPENWKSTPDDYLPVHPAEAPFELVDFDGDGIPEVIMAGEFWRYYQSYYLLRFNRGTRRLDLLAEAMGKPELHGSYIRLYYNSGHRSIFEEWDFAKIVGGKIREIGSWHDGAPYHPGDDEGPRAEGLTKSGELKLFKIEDGPADHFQLTCDDKPVATVDFSRKIRNPTELPTDYATLEYAWIFNHLTGLSPKLFPERKDELITALSTSVSASIKGDKAVVQLLNRVKD